MVGITITISFLCYWPLLPFLSIPPFKRNTISLPRTPFTKLQCLFFPIFVFKHMVKTDQKYIWAFVCWGASWKQCDKNDWMTNKWIGECNWQNDKRCYINMKYNMYDNGSPNQDIYFGGRGG